MSFCLNVSNMESLNNDNCLKNVLSGDCRSHEVIREQSRQRLSWDRNLGRHLHAQAITKDGKMQISCVERSELEFVQPCKHD